MVQRLKDAKTIAGDRVFGSRAKGLRRSQMPAILVYTKSESSALFNESPREFQRDLTVAVDLVMEGESEDALDDQLDDWAEQVERAIFLEETFGGVCSDTLLGETEMDVDTEGEKPVGAVRMSLTMPYYSRLPEDLTKDLDELSEINAKMDLAPKDGKIEAEDKVTLPQS